MTTTLNASTAGAGGFIATSDNSGVLALQTAGTTAITVDASQNVGIGTSSPTSKLHVVGSGFFTNRTIPSSGAGVEIYGDGSNYGAFLAYNRTTSAYIRQDYDALSHIWYGSGTERMRIDSSGNLLVGTTTSPSNSGNISALGAIKGGAVYQSSGFENGNYTLTTPATVYSFNKDQGGAGGSSTTTFNITGVSNVDGAFLFIYLRCSNTAGGINCGANIQVHGTQLFSAAVQNNTKTITFGAFRQNGSWVATASATGSQISAFP